MPVRNSAGIKRTRFGTVHTMLVRCRFRVCLFFLFSELPFYVILILCSSFAPARIYFNYLPFSHYRHETEQDSHSREKSDDEYDDSYEPRSVARKQWDSAANSKRNMVIAQVDLHKYKQEEVDVELRDMTIYVKGRHVTKRENGYDASEFERFYAVPEGVDPSRVSTRYSDGILKIEAPRPKRSPSPHSIFRKNLSLLHWRGRRVNILQPL